MTHSPHLVGVVATRPAARDRIVALDALRGFALCGILLVNIPWSIAQVRMPLGPRPGDWYPVAAWLDMLVRGRFFPIFSFLFGVSFALFLDTAATRSTRPRLVLARRLGVLLLLGIAHMILHPGEALVPYALFGLVVLLPASWLPRSVILLAAGVAMIGAVVLGGGLVQIPGLFLLGLATVRWGGIDALSRRRRPIAGLFALAATALVPATLWQLATRQDPQHGDQAAAVAGLVGALAYSTGLLLLLTTRVGALVQRTLAPLGRMALTNYLGATLIVAGCAPLLGLPHSGRYGRMLALAGAILLAQAVVSRWWLARHRYGPVEWVWRSLTWLRPASNRTLARRVVQPGSPS